MPGTILKEKPLDVAIIGGGITGVTLALGLHKRGINFTIYERASSFHEIGAGIGFTPNAERAMMALDERIHQAFRKVATQNSEDWFRWVDGYNYDRSNPGDMDEKPIFKLYLGERGFEGCRRSDFLQDLVSHIPEERVKFGKNLDSVTNNGDDEKLQLNFCDGTVEHTDIVLGCDGIRSRVRQLLVGIDNPAAHPTYTHKYAFRGLIPMDRARAVLGDYKVSTRFMHLGPDAHALTFPVALGAVLNVVAFVTDPSDWTSKDGKLTARATRAEAEAAFSAFGPAVRAVMALLPDELDKWAVFDTRDHPMPAYHAARGAVGGGRVCVAGDAAHASAPHHGAGAGCGIEDALVLATVMAAAESEVAARGREARAGVLRAALEVYNDVRYERSQWLVDSSRRIGELFEWQDPDCGSDPGKLGPEIEWRSRRIWDYDIDAMVVDTLSRFSRRVDG